jgi:hypothetical protein
MLAGEAFLSSIRNLPSPKGILATSYPLYSYSPLTFIIHNGGMGHYICDEVVVRGTHRVKVGESLFMGVCLVVPKSFCRSPHVSESILFNLEGEKANYSNNPALKSTFENCL